MKYYIMIIKYWIFLLLEQGFNWKLAGLEIISWNDKIVRSWKNGSKIFKYEKYVKIDRIDHLRIGKINYKNLF